MAEAPSSASTLVASFIPHRQLQPSSQASMNIIYLECKLLDITKHGNYFSEMSVFNQFLIDNI
jgi:hypothetical protein